MSYFIVHMLIEKDFIVKLLKSAIILLWNLGNKKQTLGNKQWTSILFRVLHVLNDCGGIKIIIRGNDKPLLKLKSVVALMKATKIQ